MGAIACLRMRSLLGAPSCRKSPTDARSYQYWSFGDVGPKDFVKTLEIDPI
jgi:hypothetical protein